jgi:hypothetical protein
MFLLIVLFMIKLFIKINRDDCDIFNERSLLCTNTLWFCNRNSSIKKISKCCLLNRVNIRMCFRIRDIRFVFISDPFPSLASRLPPPELLLRVSPLRPTALLPACMVIEPPRRAGRPHRSWRKPCRRLPVRAHPRLRWLVSDDGEVVERWEGAGAERH